MDAAYDHIQEQSFPDDEQAKQQSSGVTQPQPSLNEEFKDAYKAFSKSPWGAKLGGLWGTVKKQSEQYYTEAQREYTAASTQASKTFSDVLTRTRGISLSQQDPQHASVTTDREAPTSAPSQEETADATKPTPTTDASEEAAERPESLPADIVKEAESMLTRFRSEATKRLKDVQKAEDAADEALLRFGTNLRSFFRDAIAIAPPTQEEVDSGKSSVLFESKDAEGRRVIHTTRFDAQLYVIHTTEDSFTKNPASEEWPAWEIDFDVEKKTTDIASDLDKYEELRRQMERLVPENVEYAKFWCRYYFLRHVVEVEEQKRRELLKGAAQAADTSDLAWDESDEEDEKPSVTTAQPNSSTTTLTPTPATQTATDSTTLKAPVEPRKSHDQQSENSDASYDLVSGASSRAPGSPRPVAAPTATAPGTTGATKATEESDEEDWE